MLILKTPYYLLSFIHSLMGREPIYLTELSLSNIPHMRANFPGRFCDASQFTSYDGTEVPIYLIWKRRRANLPLT